MPRDHGLNILWGDELMVKMECPAELSLHGSGERHNRRPGGEYFMLISLEKLQLSPRAPVCGSLPRMVVALLGGALVLAFALSILCWNLGLAFALAIVLVRGTESPT